MEGLPRKGTWIMANMSVVPQDGKLTFVLGGAPVATIIYNGVGVPIVKLKEEEAAFWVMQFPMDKITTIDEFLEKLDGLRMSIEDKTRKIVTVPA